MNTDFEQKRQAAFERCARQAEKRLDPERHMIPGGKPHHTGAHQRASGWAVRATCEAATALAMTGRDGLAWKALVAVLEYQDRDPQSFTYGNFFWHSDWTTALDPNAVSFIVPQLCFVLRHRGSDMPVALRERLHEALRLAVEGLNAHRAAWSYTNIALLNMAAKLWIGDVLDDERARKVACWDWEEWRNHTAKVGAIPEYNSLCYTTVQIEALAMMLSCKAPPQLHCEVRNAMRHLTSNAVCDYHPEIGRITGPQSRAYENDRRNRGASGMDTVLHFVLGTPEPQGGCRPWLGMPIGPEDVLPEARDLPLPRTTLARSHGFIRTNYLAPGFALGAVSGRRHLCGGSVPVFVAYPSSDRRCSVPFIEDRRNQADAHFSDLRKGTLLLGSVFLLRNDEEDTTAGSNPEQRYWWEGNLTGLNTGKTGDLLDEADSTPGYTLELGHPDRIGLFDGSGGAVAVSAGTEVQGTVLVVETESILVGLRFFTPEDELTRLSLYEADVDEVGLNVSAPRSGLPVSALETAVMCGCLLCVVPKTETTSAPEFAGTMAKTRIAIGGHEDGWHVSAPALDDTALNLEIPARPACLYGVNDREVTANSWATSLSERDSGHRHRHSRR